MTNPIHSAVNYTFTKDVWIISCIYNSHGYENKIANYRQFIAPIQLAGLNYLIIDCAFGNQPFNLEESKNIIRIRTPHVLWQKERLLNILVRHLPDECQKVVWIDCDVLFDNPDWLAETSEKLNYYNIVQPFFQAIRLPKNDVFFSGHGSRDISFAYKFATEPNTIREGIFDRHGHTGYAWAARKNMLKNIGLYDGCIFGSADHIMAHAFVGDWESSCIREVFGGNIKHYTNFVSWAKLVQPYTDAKVSYIGGTLLHLWHGDIADRKYTERNEILQQYQFDPETDLETEVNGCWAWKNNKPELQAWVKEYFVLRREG